MLRKLNRWLDAMLYSTVWWSIERGGMGYTIVGFKRRFPHPEQFKKLPHVNQWWLARRILLEDDRAYEKIQNFVARKKRT